MTEQHIVINKLLVGGWLGALNRDSTEVLGADAILNKTTKLFCHEEKEEGGEGIPLANASGGRKRARRDTIDEDKVERGGNEIHNPSSPREGKAKSSEHLFDIVPI